MEKPLPQPTPTSEPFWKGLREHRVRIQYSPSTDQWVFYPRLVAPGSLASDLEWRDISGDGVVYSFTVARMPTAPPWEHSVPQLLAMVELKEGPRLTTELVNVAPEAIKIGMPVRPAFYDVPGTEITLLQFQPA